MEFSPATQRVILAIEQAEKAIDQYEDLRALNNAADQLNQAGTAALKENASPALLKALEYYSARIDAICRRKIYFHDYRTLFQKTITGSETVITGIRQRLFVLDSGFLQVQLGLAFPDQITDTDPLIEEASKSRGSVALIEINDALVLSSSETESDQKHDNPNPEFINSSHRWMLNTPSDLLEREIEKAGTDNKNPDKIKQKRLMGIWWNLTTLHAEALRVISDEAGNLPTSSASIISRTNGSGKIKDGVSPTFQIQGSEAQLNDLASVESLVQKKAGKLRGLTGASGPSNGGLLLQVAEQKGLSL